MPPAWTIGFLCGVATVAACIVLYYFAKGFYFAINWRCNHCMDPLPPRWWYLGNGVYCSRECAEKHVALPRMTHG